MRQQQLFFTQFKHQRQCVSYKRRFVFTIRINQSNNKNYDSCNDMMLRLMRTMSHQRNFKSADASCNYQNQNIVFRWFSQGIHHYYPHIYRDQNANLPCLSSTRSINMSTTSNSSHNSPQHDQKGSNTNEYQMKRIMMKDDIDKLPEMIAYYSLIEFLNKRIRNDNDYNNIKPPIPPKNGYNNEMSVEQIMITLDSILTTFLLHIESRIGSLIGKSYYTIGPCGEETLSSTGLCISQFDSVALHYRHVGINITKHLWHKKLLLSKEQQINEVTNNNTDTYNTNNTNDPLYDIILDRARGYTVSIKDSVTGGVHCSIGSKPTSTDQYYGSGDFIVTSTLASQCPSAVGRALGYPLRNYLLSNNNNNNNNIIDDMKVHDDNDNILHTKWIDCPEKKQVSIVTIGDGSVHNHHFWSSYHLARHAKHLNVKCPIVFGISDNGLSISYRTNGYIDTIFNTNDPLIPTYVVNGNDIMDVYSQSLDAINYTRNKSSPCIILYKNLIRRFGHAATDRQNVYMTNNEIQSRLHNNVIESMMMQIVDTYNVTSYSYILHRLYEIQKMVEESFIIASSENKVTRDDMMKRVEPPLTSLSTANTNRNHNSHPFIHTIKYDDEHPIYSDHKNNDSGDMDNNNTKHNKKDVMRKHMTSVIREVMTNDKSIVYIGEDVKHGGYYNVTENLNNEFPYRIIDFPPDETSILGVGLGYSQIGLLPIIEIPYSKYLDCGVDMLNEIAIQYWLSNGNRKNGMIIRLQGFDKGIFGGNFHTTNLLQHISPGLDYVCYSNGYDYVRGFRYAIQQAKHSGRIIVLVDCTYLLNNRHIHDKDRYWERIYPYDENDFMSFDVVCRYIGGSTTDNSVSSNCSNHDNDNNVNNRDETKLGLIDTETPRTSSCIVAYGNGVLTALQARAKLLQNGIITNENDIDIIDCPYLKKIPNGSIQLFQVDNNKTNNIDIHKMNDDKSVSSSSTPRYDSVLFADICKSGPGTGNVFTTMSCLLHQQRLLPKYWSVVCAPRTYNPLGNMSTFLTIDDIVTAWTELINSSK